MLKVEINIGFKRDFGCQKNNLICKTTFLIAVAVAKSRQKSVLLSTDQDIELIGPILLPSGFYNRKGFILSQHPLDSTISSMWQMVAEQEIQVIVVLTNLDNQVRININKM